MVTVKERYLMNKSPSEMTEAEFAHYEKIMTDAED